MDDTTRDWVTLTLQPAFGGSEVVSEPARPTENGLSVRYSFEGESIGAIVVNVACTEREEELIGNLLLAYGEHWQGLCGQDRICLHDSAFEPEHDIRCDLVSYDRLAEALLVEAGALLAENRGTEATH